MLFYIPQAAVVIYLSQRMPLEGGIYQWAKLGFNEFAGFIVAWNLWMLSITVHRARRNVRHHEHLLRDRSRRRLDAREQMVRVADQRRIGRRPWAGRVVRGLSLGKWVHNIGALCDVHRLWRADFFAASSPSARGEFKQYHPLQFALPDDVALLLLQYFHQARGRRAERI